jgi:hypothetical protein
MRTVPTLAAALIAAASGREHAHAQAMGAAVRVGATVVESPAVRLDATAATAAGTGGGVRLEVPLAVSGAGSPRVAVAGGGREGECQAVSPPAAGAGGEPALSRLRCSVPRHSAPGGVTEIRVTLVIVPAT